MPRSKDFTFSLTDPPERAKDAIRELLGLMPTVQNVRRAVRIALDKVAADPDLNSEAKERKKAEALAGAKKLMNQATLPFLVARTQFGEKLEGDLRANFDRNPMALKETRLADLKDSDRTLGEIMRDVLEREDLRTRLDLEGRVDALLGQALEDKTGAELAKLHERMTHEHEALRWTFEHHGRERVEREGTEAQRSLLGMSIDARFEDSLPESAKELLDYHDTLGGAELAAEGILGESGTERFYSEKRPASIMAAEEILGEVVLAGGPEEAN